MTHKTALMAGGLALTVAATTGLPALAANSARTVTEHFDAKSSSSPLTLNKTSYVLTDNDMKGGKQIGSDVLYCTDAGNGTSHCHVSFAQKGGFLYAKFVLADKTGALNGAVNGGTGSFAHAKGTLAGQAMSRKDVTITLHYKK